MDKKITYILLAITLPFFIFYMISNNISGFLVGIIGVGYLLVLLFISTIIAAFFDAKAERKSQELFDSFDEQTKEKIKRLQGKLNSKTSLSRKFMDDNGILMILSNNIERINRKFFVLKDSKTQRYYFLDSKISKVFIQKPSLDLTRLTDMKYHYNEEKLVYTGATVGGITTGGFHVEGGDYSKQEYSTGKYAISNRIEDKEVENICINEIYLNSDLLAKAQESNIKHYIVGKSNRLFIQHELSKQTQNNLDIAALSGDASLDGIYNKMLSIARAEVSLTKDECIEIKNWLLSNMN